MGVRSTYGDRIAAVGLGVCSMLVYLLVNPFEFTSAAVAVGLSGIPVTLVVYGVTGLSKRSALFVGAGSTLGLMLGRYLQTAGVVG